MNHAYPVVVHRSWGLMHATLRPMRQEDIPGVLAVVESGWGRMYAQIGVPDFNDMFNAAAWRPFYYVADLDGLVIGMAGYGVTWLNYGVYGLGWVGVHKQHRSLGYGKALVQRCLDDLDCTADQVMLTTDIPLFYEPFGFRTVCPLPTLQGPDDVLMARSRGSSCVS